MTRLGCLKVLKTCVPLTAALLIVHSSGIFSQLLKGLSPGAPSWPPLVTACMFIPQWTGIAISRDGDDNGHSYYHGRACSQPGFCIISFPATLDVGCLLSPFYRCRNRALEPRWLIRSYTAGKLGEPGVKILVDRDCREVCYMVILLWIHWVRPRWTTKSWPYNHSLY